MRVTKSLKYSPEPYGSYGVEVSVTNEEMGLADPTTPEEARSIFAELSKQVEALMLIEQVKLGRIHPHQISEKLRPWITQEIDTNPAHGSV